VLRLQKIVHTKYRYLIYCKYLAQIKVYNKHHCYFHSTAFSRWTWVRRFPLESFSRHSGKEPLGITGMGLYRPDALLASPLLLSSIVLLPSIRQPGFNLPDYWALLNHFRTNQSHYASCRKKWGLAVTNMCPCSKCQTMSHIVNSCPQSKLERLQQLHSADDVATKWLKCLIFYFFKIIF